jgi:hypothetical protein
VPHRVFSLLCTTVVITLILCHVVGAFCPMTVPTVEAAPIIQGAQVGHGMHGMAEGIQCQDSLTSVAKELGAKVGHACAVPEGDSVGDPGSVLPVESPAWIPHATKVPLYTLLATFRI